MGRKLAASVLANLKTMITSGSCTVLEIGCENLKEKNKEAF